MHLERGERREGKDMLVHARKPSVDTLCGGMCHFQHGCDYVLQHMLQITRHFPEMICAGKVTNLSPLGFIVCVF